MSHEMTSNPPMTNPMLAELDAVVLDAAELAELARTIEDFEDCGETETSYSTLLRWTSMGLLEVENFLITKKCRAVLAATGDSREA